jgi:hypothetical protein
MLPGLVGRWTLVAVTGFVLMACGADEAPQPDPFWDRQDIQQLVESASEFQRDILADQEVTGAEFERAMAATVQCLQDEGIPVEVRPGSDDRPFDYTMGPFATAEEVDEATRVEDECRERFSQVVALVWQLQQEREGVGGGEPPDLACARELGLQVETLAEALDMQSQLVDENPALFGELMACIAAGGPG